MVELNRLNAQQMLDNSLTRAVHFCMNFYDIFKISKCIILNRDI